MRWSLLVWLVVGVFGVSLGSVAQAVAAGDANQVSCPGETEASSGFKAFMPDCRAYEMVSPPYKAGEKLGQNALAISPDGNDLIDSSYGGFAGTENDEENLNISIAAMYKFSRTPSGWVAEPLNPPASQFTNANYMGTSTDLSHTLWDVSNQSGLNEELFGNVTYRLVIREQGPDGKGRFVAVGPESPPGAQREFQAEGYSDDLANLVFSRESRSGQLWPGDKTRSEYSSLYEYAGTGNQEPVLVAVKNAGVLAGSPHINVAAELISECGAELGGGRRGSAYNAISADGKVVYFTALNEEQQCSSPMVNEIYARVDRSRTVAISEPSLTTPGRECTGTCATDQNTEEDRKPGIFQGASEDGSKAFFTTTQPLLDGDGDTTSDLYEEELGESGVTKLIQISRGDATDPTPGSGAEVAGVSRITEDGSHVYFVARGVLTTTPNGRGEVAESGGFNLYLYDAVSGRTVFVATLASQAEFVAEGESVASEAQRVGAGQVDRRPVDVSPNGRFLVFLSNRDLTGSEDISTVPQLFEYDAQTGSLARVSAGQKTQGFPDGYNQDGNTTNGEYVPKIVSPIFSGGFLKTNTEAASSSVAEDGRVVFESRNALTPQSVVGSQNVYEYREGNVYLISPGADLASEYAAFGTGLQPFEEDSRLIDFGASGDDVFLRSLGGLVSQEADSQTAWYDARVDGGFAESHPPAECVGDACQGSLSAPFAAPAAGSATTVAGGNLVVAPTVVAKSKPKKAHVKPKKKKRKKKGKVKGRRSSARARNGKAKSSRRGGK